MSTGIRKRAMAGGMNGLTNIMIERPLTKEEKKEIRATYRARLRKETCAEDYNRYQKNVKRIMGGGK